MCLTGKLLVIETMMNFTTELLAFPNGLLIGAHSISDLLGYTYLNKLAGFRCIFFLSMYSPFVDIRNSSVNDFLGIFQLSPLVLLNKLFLLLSKVNLLSSEDFARNN